MTVTTASEVVIEASRLFDFIRTPAGEPYALPKDGNRRHVALTLDQAATHIAAVFFRVENHDIPTQQTMASALAVLSALTVDAEIRDVDLRLARIDNVSYLDLGTPSGEYVEIRPTGWAVRDPRKHPCPATFVRTATTNALPVPVPAEDGRADLARLLALSTEDNRFRVAWAWLTAQVLPTTARPMLYLLGSQGSGKTTRGLLLANVLEPQDELGAVLKKSERENNPVAKASFILTADNMTKMSEDVSNWLCSLVTGLRVQERKLYTNAETIAYSLKRTGLFTGKIKPAGLESDAEERMIFLEFERMTTGIRADDDLLAEFRTLHSGILAALLDDMVAALMRLPLVDAADVRAYRFVNFGKVFVALDRHYGLDPDAGHLAAAIAAATDQQTERVHDAPDLVAVMRVVASEGGKWEGSAAALLAAMGRWAPEDAGRQSGPWWPSSAAQLGTRLRNQQHALSLAGLRIEFVKSNGRRRIEASMSPADARAVLAPETRADIEIINLGGKK
ncbi:hypothetical protein O7630_31655 [Micromonospora sp. WMMD718]|uniref:hypothetical protein n=1 Tax=Micromonospora sp. WMMD718 TaxID=3016098 RepID=UPI0024160CB4|nr:hypothetical protein [Micromonospora sp. WMMD718]MDG4755502.1 hypothetical protein [Micromonospora sp. WMMD718]